MSLISVALPLIPDTVRSLIRFEPQGKFHPELFTIEVHGQETQVWGYKFYSKITNSQYWVFCIIPNIELGCYRIEERLGITVELEGKPLSFRKRLPAFFSRGRRPWVEIGTPVNDFFATSLLEAQKASKKRAKTNKKMKSADYDDDQVSNLNMKEKNYKSFRTLLTGKERVKKPTMTANFKLMSPLTSGIIGHPGYERSPDKSDAQDVALEPDGNFVISIAAQKCLLMQNTKGDWTSYDMKLHLYELDLSQNSRTAKGSFSISPSPEIPSKDAKLANWFMETLKRFGITEFPENELLPSVMSNYGKAFGYPVCIEALDKTILKLPGGDTQEMRLSFTWFGEGQELTDIKIFCPNPSITSKPERDSKMLEPCEVDMSKFNYVFQIFGFQPAESIIAYYDPNPLPTNEN